MLEHDIDKTRYFSRVENTIDQHTTMRQWKNNYISGKVDRYSIIYKVLRKFKMLAPGLHEGPGR